MVSLIAWNNTDCTCTVCRRHFERARSETNDSIWGDHQPLLWTLRPRPPLHPRPPPPPPRPRWAKGRNDHLFVLCEHSRHARRHHCAAEMYRSLDGRSSFPKGKYSPSESESANNICNILTVQLFISLFAIFSHNLLTGYELLPHQ